MYPLIQHHSEPSYQSTGPNNDYIYKDIMIHFSSLTPSLTRRHQHPHRCHLDTNIAYSIMNLGYLSLLVKEEINKEYKKYGCFGSYRGYASFARKNIIENIMDNIETRKKSIAYHKLCNSSIVHVLKDSVLYKPGSKRVEGLKQDFEAKSKSNKQ
jgi:hypothetical protein